MSLFKDGYLKLYKISNNKNNIYVDEQCGDKTLCKNATSACSNSECYRGVSKEKFLKRLNISLELYNSFYKTSCPGSTINKSILVHCIESYFIDVYRLKDYHNIKFADEHKRFAYTLKWFSKLKPIQIGESKDPNSMLLNEIFAYHLAVSHLNINAADIPSKIKNEILYILKYRTQDDNSWSLLAFLIEQVTASYKDRGELFNLKEKSN